MNLPINVSLNTIVIILFFSLPFVKTVNTILKVRLGEYDVSTTAEPLKHEVSTPHLEINYYVQKIGGAKISMELSSNK